MAVPLVQRGHCVSYCARLSLRRSPGSLSAALLSSSRCVSTSISLKASHQSNHAAASGQHKRVVIVGAGPVGLATSLLLAKAGVPSTVLEQRSKPTSHPQAHFINTRTMEVFRAISQDLEKRVAEASPPREQWQDFVYCESLTGQVIATDHHFGNDPEETLAKMRQWSACLPTHLAQTQLVPILLDECHKHKGLIDLRWNFTVTGCKKLSDSQVQLEGAEDSGSFVADYVVAADGANSIIRKHVLIPMLGDAEPLQHLVNIHFYSKDLSKKLVDIGRLGMLYTVWNPEVIGVLVAHDHRRGEFVLQVPFFPPYEDPDRDFSAEKSLHKIRSASGMPDLKVDLQSVRPWRMAAMTAARYRSGNVFLAGDACHFFPPAGAFGMNTGIQDAHDLAWRIALAAKGDADSPIFDGYDKERRPVAQANAELSVSNVKRVWKISSALGLSPTAASSVIKAVNKAPLLGTASKTNLIQSVFSFGRKQLASLQKQAFFGPLRLKQARRLVEKGLGLPMLFPGQDLGFRYTTSDTPLPGTVDSVIGDPFSFSSSISEGVRFPHMWLTCGNDTASSLDVVSSTLGFKLFVFDDSNSSSSSSTAAQVAMDEAKQMLRQHGICDTTTIETVSLRPKTMSDRETWTISDDDALLFKAAGNCVLVRPDGHVMKVWKNQD